MTHINSEPTENEMYALELMRKLKEAQQKEDLAWSVLYGMYSRSQEYRDYENARKLKWTLKDELDKVNRI